MLKSRKGIIAILFAIVLTFFTVYSVYALDLNKSVITWNNGKYEEFSDVLLYNDGYVVVGGSYSNANNKIDGNAYIAKYNSSDTLVDSATLTGNDSSFYHDATVDANKNIIVAGYTNNTGIAGETNNLKDEYPVLIRYDENLDIQWSSYVTGVFGRFYSVVSVDDGYIAVGTCRSLTGVENYDGIAVKYDFLGNEKWRINVGGDQYDQLRYIEKVDNGFILAGRTKSTINGVANKGYHDLYFVKLKDNGNSGEVLWEKTFGGNHEERILNMKSFGDELAVVGYSKSSNIPNLDLKSGTSGLFLKLDSDGLITTKKMFAGHESEHTHLIDVLETVDGYIFTARTDSSYFDDSLKNNFDYRPFIIETDKSLKVKKYKMYGNRSTSMEIGFQKIINSSNGVIAVGFGIEKSAPTTDAIIIHFDKLKITKEANNGSVSVVSSANIDEEVTVTATADTGYELDSIKIISDSGETTLVGNTFIMPNSDVVVKAIFKKKSYEVNASSGVGGSISPSGTFSREYKTKEKFDISLDPGFKVKSIMVDNVDQTSLLSGDSFEVMIDAPKTVQVQFEKVKLNVDVTAGVGGSISPNTLTVIEYGDDFTLNMTSDEGYEITSVKVNEVEKLIDVENDKLKLENIKENTKIVVKFSKKQFEITTTSNSGGNVTVENGSTVSYHDNKKVLITPEFGYEIKTVLLDGNNVTALVTSNELLLTAVEQNHDVEVEFVKKKYNLSVTTTGGTSDIVSEIVEFEDSKTIKFSPSASYILKTATINGVSVIDLIKNNELKIENISENITAVVVFEEFIYSSSWVEKGTFTSNGQLELVSKIFVDGIELNKSQFSLSGTNGNIIVTLVDDFLKSLKSTEHELKILYENNGEAITKFRLSYNKVIENPNTVDNILNYIILTVIGLTGIVTLVYRKKINQWI